MARAVGMGVKPKTEVDDRTLKKQLKAAEKENKALVAVNEALTKEKAALEEKLVALEKETKDPEGQKE